MRVALGAMLLPLPACILLAQNPAPDNAVAGPAEAASSSSGDPDRILGILPNFLTVSDPQTTVEPLTSKQKFALVARQTYDPVTIMSAAGGAALSQAGNSDPQYGRGGVAYAKRFGAAMADLSTQNFFGGAVLASVFREDPRYFRKGPQFGFWNRLGYALTRSVVTRTDAGKQSFDYADILGMGMGIALSNTYYPDASVNGSEVAERFGTSLLSSALSNVLPEFWPDIRDKLVHRRRRDSSAAPAPQP